MITEDIIRKEFISGVVLKGVGEIYEAITGTLQSKVSGSVAGILAGVRPEQDGRGHFTMRVGVGLRLLDIRYSRLFGKKYRIYNRAVWPMLYRSVMPKIQYDFTRDCFFGADCCRLEKKGYLCAAKDGNTVHPVAMWRGSVR